MDPKVIGILIGFLFLVCLAVFIFIRKKKAKDIYLESESKLFLSNLTSAVMDVIDDYLTIDNFKKVLEDHYLDDFVDSDNYIMNLIINDLYDKIYDFILLELEEMSTRDSLSKSLYKFVKKSRDIPDSIVYNFIYHILESDNIKLEIENLSVDYWEKYRKELDDLEDEHQFSNEEDYIDFEKESDFVPEKEDEDEIDESSINPPSDEEIPFDESIDEIIEEDEEEVTYFFDSKGRKRDKKTGRYVK